MKLSTLIQPFLTRPNRVRAPGSIPESCVDRLPIPPKGVLGLGLVRAGKAFAGDWGLLNAELREVGNPGLCGAAVPPRFRDPIPARGSIWRTPSGENQARRWSSA